MLSFNIENKLGILFQLQYERKPTRLLSLFFRSLSPAK
uniref:Uncharacterized protein n=1 Tax=Arundo donax TaxID=35708 RepID=A0A0A8Y1H1_ARUDO